MPGQENKISQEQTQTAAGQAKEQAQYTPSVEPDFLKQKIYGASANGDAYIGYNTYNEDGLFGYGCVGKRCACEKRRGNPGNLSDRESIDSHGAGNDGADRAGVRRTVLGLFAGLYQTGRI